MVDKSSGNTTVDDGGGGERSEVTISSQHTSISNNSTISSAVLLANRLGGRFLLGNIDQDRSNTNSGSGGFTTRMNRRRHHNRHHEDSTLSPSSTHSLSSTTARSNKNLKDFYSSGALNIPINSTSMHAVINTSSPNPAQKSKRNCVLNAVHAVPASLRLTPLLEKKRRGKAAAVAAAAASVAADTAFTVVMTEGSSNAIDEDTQQQLREQVNHCYGSYATASDACSTSTTNNKENEGTTR